MVRPTTSFPNSCKSRRPSKRGKVRMLGAHRQQYPRRANGQRPYLLPSLQPADTRANASPKRKQGITRVTFHAGSGSAWVSGPVDWSPTNRHRSLRRPDPARTEPEPRSHSIADRPAARESGRMSRHNDRSWQTPPTLRCRVEPASVDFRRVLDQRIRPVCGRCRHAHPPTSARRESPFRRPAHSGKSRSGSRWAPAAERHPGLPVQCAAGPR